MPRRTTMLTAAVLLGVLAAGCGGGAPEVDEATAPTVLPAIEPTVPTELALADIDVGLAGPTSLRIAPGATATVDHVLTNLATGDRSLRVTARPGDGEFMAEPGPSSVRLEAGSSAAITTTVVMGPSVEVGDVVTLELIAVDGDDTAQRASVEIDVEIVASQGATPDAVADRASTATNQQVVVYVVGNDVDPDGDLDLASLRIVGGGDLAASTAANADGTIVYEPFSNLTGTDVVLYEICDLAGACDTGSVTVTIG